MPTYETKLITSIADFTSPFSYEETMKQIEENNWILILTRFQVSNRIIRDEKWNETQVASNTKVTARIDTNKTPILCYEEYEMVDITNTDLKSKKK